MSSEFNKTPRFDIGQHLRGTLQDLERERVRKLRELTEQQTRERFEQVKRELYGEKGRRSELLKHLWEEGQLLEKESEPEPDPEPEKEEFNGRNYWVPNELIGIIETILEDAGLETKAVEGSNKNVEVRVEGEDDGDEYSDGGEEATDMKFKIEFHHEFGDGFIEQIRRFQDEMKEHYDR